ncbi:hypothetical protein PENSPDRAFT_215486 [Peniophora sp. CONT]|nr:hypothetical protein PENSPDRAFT_215486 [Peniophora sp. CONT]
MILKHALSIGASLIPYAKSREPAVSITHEPLSEVKMFLTALDPRTAYFETLSIALQRYSALEQSTVVVVHLDGGYELVLPDDPDVLEKLYVRMELAKMLWVLERAQYHNGEVQDMDKKYFRSAWFVAWDMAANMPEDEQLLRLLRTEMCEDTSRKLVKGFDSIYIAPPRIVFIEKDAAQREGPSFVERCMKDMRRHACHAAMLVHTSPQSRAALAGICGYRGAADQSDDDKVQAMWRARNLAASLTFSMASCVGHLHVEHLLEALQEL